MGKIIGIGGIFLNFKGSKDAVQNWYEEHLGLNMSSYGSGFIEGDQLLLLSFKRSVGTAEPIINFRVDNILELINHLRGVSCDIINDIAEYDYGLFAQFIDPFGNKIELWEPNRDEYIRMVKNEIMEYKKKKSNR